MELLRQYAHRKSEEAFAVLVTRHVNVVYSAALRKTGNAHAAEEITQAVFIILAKKADRLRDGTILSGWLYQTARLTSASFLRTEIRRARREQEAYMQSLSNEPEAKVWPEIEPLLEDAMGRLGEKERNALALRFFEGKSFQEIGAAMGVTENAAKKRVSHGLEKLRKFFTKRGVSSTTAIIAGTISANSVQAAPVALAKSVTAVAIAKGAAASGSTLTLIKGALKIMAWTKAKTAIVVGVGILLTAGTTTVVLSGSYDYGENLRKAAYTGDIQTVRRILNKHPRVINTFRGKIINGSFTKDSSAKATDQRLQSQFDVWDDAGYSALDMAVKGKHPEVVSVLLDNGADVTHLTANNCAALHQAIQIGDVEIVKRFLEHNVDLKIKDATGSTPLDWAVLCQHKDIAELLLAHGADVNDGDMPPLHWAVEVKSKPMAELLIQHGANVNLADKWKRTPLSMAVTNGDDELATFLREHGARE